MAKIVFGAVKVNYNNLRNKVAFTKEHYKLMHNSPSLYFFYGWLMALYGKNIMFMN